jgi:hypothetical protein
LYVCFTVVVLPARSVAVTENVCGPTLEVSIAPPSGVVPAHVSTPEPSAVSAHEYEALAAEPRMIDAPSAGLLAVIVGSLRSTSKGPNASVDDEFPATSDTLRAPIASVPSPVVESVNEPSAGFARPEVASLAAQPTVTALVNQPLLPCVPLGAPHETEGATVSMLNGPNGPAVVEFPALSFTTCEGVESAPSPVVASENDASDAFANPDCASLATHEYATSLVYQPALPWVPVGPEHETVGGVLSLASTTWKVTNVGVSSRSVDPLPGGVVIVV